MTSSNSINKQPQLPAFLCAPFKVIPDSIHSKILATFLNQILSQQAKDEELDFLEQRNLCITIIDTNTSYYLSLNKQRFVNTSPNNKIDLLLKARIYDFLTLAARQEDPDTLVFQRRLIMEGDTELGLELKNFLDGVDIDSNGRFTIIESLLKKSLPTFQRLLR